jgi:hypothetical protein
VGQSIGNHVPPRLRSQSLIPRLSLAGVLAWAAFVQGAPVDDSKPAPQVGSTDELKIKNLEERSKILDQKLEELERLFANLDPGVREEWQNGLEELNLVHTRLSNLRVLVRLRIEIPALEQRKKLSSEALQKLEADWELKRSELRKSMLVARMNQYALERLSDATPPGPVERAKRDRGFDPSEGVSRAVRDHAASAEKLKEKADVPRKEARSLWDRAASVRDEILDIDASIEVAHIIMQSLEKTRDAWDRDKPKGK